jgi:hypothetical protein
LFFPIIDGGKTSPVAERPPTGNPAVQAPRAATINPTSEMAKGLNVAFKFRNKKIKSTNGTKMQPKNHPRLHL